MLVLRNCRFVKELTEGTDLPSGDLVLKDDRIFQILPCGAEVKGTYEERNIDGAVVLPGLINAHVYLFMIQDLDFFMKFDSVPKKTLDCLKFGRFLLENGYTTVRDCGDDASCPTVAIRDRVNAGELIGPNIITCGTILSPSDVGFEPFDWITTFVDTPMDVRRQARKNLAKGTDFVKLYGSGSMFTDGSKPGRRIMTDDEIREAVEIAELWGTYATIHAHGAEAIEASIRNGVRTIEHATYINNKSIEMLADRTDAGIIPTVSLVHAFLSQETLDENQKKIIDDMSASLKNAYTSKVLIGWGTDIAMTHQQKESGMEFRLRKELLGYSNIDLLKQATINSAKLICMDDKVGTIKEGKYADLVIVSSDSVDNISIMYAPPLHVIKSGVFVK